MTSPAQSRTFSVAALALAVTFAVTGCSAASTSSGTSELSSSPPASSSSDAATFFPDVEEVQVTESGTNTFGFAVTISSAYDTPQQYADGWRVLSADGTVFGEHTLTHDHARSRTITPASSRLRALSRAWKFLTASLRSRSRVATKPMVMAEPPSRSSCRVVSGGTISSVGIG